jgi:hypothetical protein
MRGRAGSSPFPADRAGPLIALAMAFRVGRAHRSGTRPLTDPQDADLTAEAARLGITIADLIRRIIDDYRTAHEPPTRET